MIRHLCGTVNADHARFCKGCGESLAAQTDALCDGDSSMRATDGADCPACGTTLKPGKRFCVACGADLASVADAPVVDAPADPTVREVEPLSEIAPARPSSPVQAGPSRNRAGLLIAAAVVAMVCAGLGTWWFVGRLESPPAQAAAELAIQQEPEVMQTGSEAARPSQGVERPVPVAAADDAGDEEDVAEPEGERQTRTERREALAVAREEVQRSARAAQQRAGQAAREPGSANVTSVSRTGPPTPVNARTERIPSPQQACAGKDNFISRAICEARQCQRSEHAQTPYCIEMRARPNNVQNGELY